MKAILLAVVGGLAACGPRGDDGSNEKELARLRNGPPGLYKDLAAGRFKPGSKLANVTAAYPPDAVLTHGRYTTAVYANGSFSRSLTHVYVSEADGRLVFAFGVSCVWRPVFFDTLADTDRGAWWDTYLKAHTAHLARLRELPGLAPPGIAVGGPAAAVAHGRD